MDEEEKNPAGSFLADDEQQDHTITAADSVVDLPTDDNHYLPSGEELSEDEIPAITNNTPAKLILIMGEPNSGKTTLLLSLFDRFQKGPFGRYYFAGSRTLRGYEQRCHMARLSSGLIKADTPRTTTTQFHYLHLAVRAKPFLEKPMHLLFADVSGEQFKLARDHDDDMLQLKIISRADHVFCTIDGELLGNKNKRHSAKQNLITLIARGLQTGMLTKKITIIITKWDKLVQSGEEGLMETFFIQPIKDKFPNSIEEIVKMAARPTSALVSPGLGLDKFLSLCATDIIEDVPQYKVKAHRMFHKYNPMLNGGK